jgi:hypothetical protein
MSTLGGTGSSLSGGGAGFGGGGAGKSAGLGKDDSDGKSDGKSDFFWKENCDFVAEDFSAASEGTRRPRGRFSESKIAIFRQFVCYLTPVRIYEIDQAF